MKSLIVKACCMTSHFSTMTQYQMSGAPPSPAATNPAAAPAMNTVTAMHTTGVLSRWEPTQWEIDMAVHKIMGATTEAGAAKAAANVHRIGVDMPDTVIQTFEDKVARLRNPNWTLPMAPPLPRHFNPMQPILMAFNELHAEATAKLAAATKAVSATAKPAAAAQPTPLQPPPGPPRQPQPPRQPPVPQGMPRNAPRPQRQRQPVQRQPPRPIPQQRNSPARPQAPRRPRPRQPPRNVSQRQQPQRPQTPRRQQPTPRQQPRRQPVPRQQKPRQQGQTVPRRMPPAPRQIPASRSRQGAPQPNRGGPRNTLPRQGKVYKLFPF